MKAKIRITYELVDDDHAATLFKVSGLLPFAAAVSSNGDLLRLNADQLTREFWNSVALMGYTE